MLVSRMHLLAVDVDIAISTNHCMAFHILPLARRINQHSAIQNTSKVCRTNVNPSAMKGMVPESILRNS